MITIRNNERDRIAEQNDRDRLMQLEVQKMNQKESMTEIANVRQDRILAEQNKRSDMQHQDIMSFNAKKVADKREMHDEVLSQKNFLHYDDQGHADKLLKQKNDFKKEENNLAAKRREELKDKDIAAFEKREEARIKRENIEKNEFAKERERREKKSDDNKQRQHDQANQQTMLIFVAIIAGLIAFYISKM